MLFKILKIILIFTYISFFINIFASQNKIKSKNDSLIFSSPIELKWENEKWDEINFSKVTLPNRSSLYTSELKQSALFYISIIFNGGKFTVSKEEEKSLDAMLKVFYWNITHNNHPVCISGGSDNLETSFNFNENGQAVLQVKGLKQYLEHTLQFLNCLIKNPVYHKDSIKYWKEEQISNNKYYLDANSHSYQLDLIRSEAFHLAFNKYFNDFIIKDIEHVTEKKVLKLHQEIIQKNGLKLVYLGDTSSQNIEAIKKFMSRIPNGKPNYIKWLPEKLHAKCSSKVKAKIIIKPDMAQSNIVLNYFYPESNHLNIINMAKMNIISEAYYSASIGTDRFSKALRSDTGFSYSPYAFHDEDIFSRNSEGRIFSMSFESPNNKISETVFISLDTWKNFIDNGISENELNSSRNSLINQEMTKEYSILKTLDNMTYNIAENTIPAIDPTEYIALLDSQRNTKEINSVIKNIFSEPSIPVLVIIGNPDLSEIEKLKNDGRIESVEVIKLKDYQKTLLK
jgi:predicted Zn-dependent peptidase